MANALPCTIEASRTHRTQKTKEEAEASRPQSNHISKTWMVSESCVGPVAGTGQAADEERGEQRVGQPHRESAFFVLVASGGAGEISLGSGVRGRVCTRSRNRSSASLPRSRYGRSLRRKPEEATS